MLSTMNASTKPSAAVPPPATMTSLSFSLVSTFGVCGGMTWVSLIRSFSATLFCFWMSLSVVPANVVSCAAEESRCSLSVPLRVRVRNGPCAFSARATSYFSVRPLALSCRTVSVDWRRRPRKSAVAMSEPLR